MNTENCQSELTPEVKKVITESPFLALASISKEGNPHLIVVGKAKEIRGNSCIVLGVYKMETTQKNIAETGQLQIAAVSGTAGYRLIGRASVEEKEVLFSVEKVESLL